VGRKGLKGVTPFTEFSWTFRNDPYFEHGINACKSIINYNATKDNESQLYRDYLPFFNGSAAYMLLWTIIERFCALKYGNLSPSEKLKCLINDSDIDWGSILSGIERTDVIYRSDKADYSVKLDRMKGPKKVLEYYYAIRSNMVHRGKDVFDDASRIQNSFYELEKIFQTILSMHNYSISSQNVSSETIK
jgi:hypothetical protein